ATPGWPCFGTNKRSSRTTGTRMRGRGKASPFSSSNGTGRDSPHTIEPCPSNPATSWRRNGGRPASGTWSRRNRSDASAGDGGPVPPQRRSVGEHDAGGASLLRPGADVGAARCIDEALHLDPDFYDAMANRVLLYRRMKRHGETVLWADRALRLREAPWLWHVKGTAHLGLRESTLAIKAFEHALALDPKSKEARAGLRKAKTL